MNCSCGREMVEITMTTPEGPVSLAACSACDRTEWLVHGKRVEVAEALEQLSTAGRRS